MIYGKLHIQLLFAGILTLLLLTSHPFTSDLTSDHVLFLPLVSIAGVIAGFVSWENPVLQLFLLFIGMTQPALRQSDLLF